MVPQVKEPLENGTLWLSSSICRPTTSSMGHAPFWAFSRYVSLSSMNLISGSLLPASANPRALSLKLSSCRITLSYSNQPRLKPDRHFQSDLLLIWGVRTVYYFQLLVLLPDDRVFFPIQERACLYCVGTLRTCASWGSLSFFNGSIEVTCSLWKCWRLWKDFQGAFASLRLWLPSLSVS